MEVEATDPLAELPPFDEDSFKTQLTAKQIIFVEEYLIDLHISKASLRAGVSPTTGMSWLKLPVIASHIRKAMAQRLVRTQMTQDQVLKEMSLLSHSRVDHYLVNDKGDLELAEGAPEGAMGAVQSVKRRITTRTDPKTNEVVREVVVEIKLWDKPTPLRLMGRHAGLFPDRMEHTGPGGGPIETVTKIERVIVDGLAKQMGLLEYMAAKSSVERDAEYLRILAQKILDPSQVVIAWEIPSIVSSTLNDISTRMITRGETDA